jgi:hypothetical protein
MRDKPFNSLAVRQLHKICDLMIQKKPQTEYIVTENGASQSYGLGKRMYDPDVPQMGPEARNIWCPTEVVLKELQWNTAQLDYGLGGDSFSDTYSLFSRLYQRFPVFQGYYWRKVAFRNESADVCQQELTAIGKREQMPKNAVV